MNIHTYIVVKTKTYPKKQVLSTEVVHNRMMSNGIPVDDNITLRVNTACFNVVSSGAAPAQADLASDEHSFLLFCLFFHNFQVQRNYSIEYRRPLASENKLLCWSKSQRNKF